MLTDAICGLGLTELFPKRRRTEIILLGKSISTVRPETGATTYTLRLIL